MSRDINPFGLRMPEHLRSQIKAAADESGRSMNAEIVARLEESFKPPALFDQLQADVARLIEKVDRMDKGG